MSLARAALSGVVVTDPEKRFTQNNTAVVNFTIEVACGARNESPFLVNVACWRGLADVVAEQLRKGMNVLVEGRLQVNQFDQGGISRRIYEIDATNIAVGQLEPLVPAFEGAQQGNWQGPSPANEYAAPQPVGARTQAAPAVQPAQSFDGDEPLTEDDIPF